MEPAAQTATTTTTATTLTTLVASANDTPTKHLPTATIRNEAITKRSQKVVPEVSQVEEKFVVLENALQIFQDVLGALREGSDPVSAVLRGMIDLLSLYGL